MLVAIGDEYGLSYYPERALSSLLALPLPEIAAARRRLEAADVLTYEAPLSQVLSLDGARAAIPEEARQCSTIKPIAKSARCEIRPRKA